MSATKRIPGLDFGTLDLPSRKGPLMGGKLRFDVMVNGVEIGGADPVTFIAESLMLDGQDEQVDHFTGVEHSFRVQIKGDTPDIAGHGEALLGAQLGRRNTLIYTPRESGSVATKWIVTTSWMKPLFKLWDELKKKRIYLVTIKALPWGFSTETVTVIGAPSGSAPVSVDPATSATKWSCAGHTKTQGTYFSDSAILFENAGGQFPVLKWTGTIPSTAYVAIDVTLRSASSGTQQVYPPFGLDFGGTHPIGVEPQPNGWMRLYYPTADMTQGGSLVFPLGINTDLWDFMIGGLFSAAAPASAGTMVFGIQGSARTPAEIHVAGSSMDWCFVYSDPTMLEYGWSPGHPATWPYAPTGRYVLHAPAANLLPGDLVLTAAGGLGTIRNRILRAGDPLAILEFGGNPEGRLGTTPFTTSTKNGVPITADVFMFRIKKRETALTYDRDAGSSLLIQPPSLLHEFGGVWSNNQASTADWEFPVFTPPVSALFVACNAYLTVPPITTITYAPANWTYASRVKR